MPEQDTIDFFLGAGRASRANVINSLEAEPERAARATELSEASGMDASLIYGNLDTYEHQIRAGMAARLVDVNQYLASYVDSSPMAAKISNDDYGQLDTVSQRMTPFQGGSIWGAFFKGLQEGFDFEGQGEEYLRLYNYVDNPVWRAFIGNKIFGAAIVTPSLVLHGFNAAFTGVSGAVGQAATNITGSEAWGARAARDTMGLLQVGMAGQGGLAGVGGASRFNRAIEPYIRAGKEPPLGVDPIIDQVKARQAQEDVTALNEALASAVQSATRERSPEMFAGFIRQHTEGNIGVSADAIAQLYGDVPPTPGDGLLGWVPRLAEQMAIAKETGGDVQIPIADWLAKVDPAVAKQLEMFTRVRPDGVTLAEAAEGVIAYHGSPYEFEAFDISKIGSGEGAQSYGHGLYFAENPTVAKDYQQKLTGGWGYSIAKKYFDAAGGNKYKAVEAFREAVASGDEFVRREDMAAIEDLIGMEAKPGSLYRVRIKVPQEAMLDWDRPLNEQPPKVQEVLNRLRKENNVSVWEPGTGGDIYNDLAALGGTDLQANRAGVSNMLKEAGIPGIRYLDQGSRKLTEVKADIERAKSFIAAGQDAEGTWQRNLARWEAEAAKPETRNFVLFDDSLVEILDRNGEAVQSVRQAAKLDPLPAEPEVTSLPPVAPGTIRFYHGGPPEGGSLPSEGGGRWVTQDYTYAQNYRSVEGRPGQVWYIDIPEKWLEEAGINKSFDDTGSSVKAPYVHFEVPEELAKQMKPADGSQVVPKTAEAPPAGFKPGWMTVAQYNKYLALIEARHAADVAAAQKRFERQQRERLTPEWKEKENVVREEVAQAIASDPMFAADEFFREGMLFGKEVPRLRIGEGFLNEEQRSALPGSFVTKNGINPDDVAGLFGYRSGDELVFALAQLHQQRTASGKNAPAYRRAVIDAETARVMEERYGAFHENVVQAAKEQVLSEVQLDLLHEEVKILGGEQFPITKEQFAGWVKEKFANSLVGEVSSDKFLRDAGVAGRKVESALLAADPAEAFRQRQRQYLAVSMAKEAVALEKDMAKVEKLAKTFRPRDVKAVNAEYTPYIQMLLRQAGYSGRMTVAELQSAIDFHGGKTLQQFTDGIKGDGWEPEVAPWMDGGMKPVEKMTTVEFREFKDALESLNHIGREVQKIEIAGQKQDFAEFKEKVLDHITKLPARDKETQGKWLYEADASLTRMEEMIKDLDLRKELGPLYRSVIEPMMKSKAKEFDLITDLAKHFKETRGSFGRAWRKSLNDSIPNDFLVDPYTNSLFDLSRENLIQIMLNWGNRSNIEKFTQGYASLELGRKATKEEAAAFEVKVKSLIDAHATKEDWEFVQRMWEPFKKWQPMTDVVSRNVSGVSPKWIEAEAVKTPHGEFDGGYWPVKYDRLSSNLAVIEDRTSSDALFGPNYFRAATAKSFLKERTGYTDFVDISTSIEQAAGVMQQVIHDIAFRDSLVQANKVLMDKNIRAAIRKHYGVEYEAQLMPWLKRIANKNTVDDRAIKWFNDWQRRVRVNTIGHILPLNLKVIFSPDVGVPNVKSWLAFEANRSENVKLAMEKSNEIRHLVYNMDRDFREQLELAFKNKNFESFQVKAVEWGFTPMMKVSQEFRMATFVDQFNKAKGRGLSDYEASVVADSYVRERHGAASVVDLPAIMQSSETMKSLTMFYGFFNTMYNWQRQIPGNVRRREWGDAGVNALGSVIVGAAFGALLFNEAKEDDSWFKTIGKALALQPLSTIPIVRDVANWWLEGRNPRTPTTSLFQAFGSLYTDLRRKVQGEPMKKPVQNTANVIGMATGLPLAQVGRTGEFAYDVARREQRPRNFQEWIRGIITGESQLKKSR